MVLPRPVQNVYGTRNVGKKTSGSYNNTVFAPVMWSLPGSESIHLKLDVTLRVIYPDAERENVTQPTLR